MANDERRPDEYWHFLVSIEQWWSSTFHEFWCQIAIAALLRVIHLPDELKYQVMWFDPPWESPPWMNVEGYQLD